MCVGTGLWDGLGDRVKNNLFRQAILTSGNNYVQVINAWAALGTVWACWEMTEWICILRMHYPT